MRYLLVIYSRCEEVQFRIITNIRLPFRFRLFADMFGLNFAEFNVGRAGGFLTFPLQICLMSLLYSSAVFHVVSNEKQYHAGLTIPSKLIKLP